MNVGFRPSTQPTGETRSALGSPRFAIALDYPYYLLDRLRNVRSHPYKHLSKVILGCVIAKSASIVLLGICCEV